MVEGYLTPRVSALHVQRSLFSLPAVTYLATLVLVLGLGVAPLFILAALAIGVYVHPLQAVVAPSDYGWTSLLRSLSTAALFSIVQVGAAVLATSCLYSVWRRSKAIWLLGTMVVLPLSIPPLAAALTWRALLSS